MSWRLVCCFLAIFIGGGDPAHALELNGALTQGGLVTGRVDPGTKVTVGKRQLRVSPEGFFLLGFGRDAPAKISLRILHLSGMQENKILRIKSRTWKTSRVNGLPGRKVTPKPEALRRIQADSAKIKKVRRLSTKAPHFLSGIGWPLTGRISGVFGSQRILNGKPRRPHVGTDIAAPLGTPVLAIADGVVALVHQDMFFTGKTLMIDHGHGLASVYAHMDKILVTEGAPVTKGTAIGQVGKTGRATGPHLHWGISLFATHLDPELVAGKK
jgi:hypothetical protein